MVGHGDGWVRLYCVSSLPCLLLNVERFCKACPDCQLVNKPVKKAVPAMKPINVNNFVWHLLTRKSSVEFFMQFLEPLGDGRLPQLATEFGNFVLG